MARARERDAAERDHWFVLKSDEAPQQGAPTFEATLDLPEGGKLGVSVVKGMGGWFVKQVNQGPVREWNIGQPLGRRIVPGDKMLSANGTPLVQGVQASEYAVGGSLRVCVQKAEAVSVDVWGGQRFEGTLLWDRRPARPMIFALRHDGAERALVDKRGQWHSVRADLARKFLESGAVVVCNGMHLGDEGARELALLLEVLRDGGVQHVCLNNNGIRDSGALALAEAIDSSNAIQQLDLFGNFFDAALRERIDETLLQRRRRCLVLTATAAAQTGDEVRVCLCGMGGDQPFAPVTVGCGTLLGDLRRQLEGERQAAGRRVVLLSPGLAGRMLHDTERAVDLPSSCFGDGTTPGECTTPGETTTPSECTTPSESST